MDSIRFLPCGEAAVTVEFSREIKEETNAVIRYLASRLESGALAGVRETVPAFCSLTVYFDPLLLPYEALQKEILAILSRASQSETASRRIFCIPVCYEGEYAPDMEDVCRLTGLNREEVIRLHSGRDYLIYMLGFLPGFPYLGGMDPRLEAPRLDSPRTAIPVGSVGIGGKQTGIYPLSSPGGWRLIGRVPVTLYDPQREPAVLYRAGDHIRFFPISKEEFNRYAEENTVEIKEETV